VARFRPPLVYYALKVRCLECLGIKHHPRLEGKVLLNVNMFMVETLRESWRWRTSLSTTSDRGALLQPQNHWRSENPPDNLLYSQEEKRSLRVDRLQNLKEMLGIRQVKRLVVQEVKILMPRPRPMPSWGIALINLANLTNLRRIWRKGCNSLWIINIIIKVRKPQLLPCLLKNSKWLKFIPSLQKEDLQPWKKTRSRKEMKF